MNLLNGLKVVEIAGGIKGGYCGKLFADSGAEVVKVSLPDGEADGRLRVWLDPGKASVVLDWRLPEGRQLLRGLVGSADILVVDDEVAQGGLGGDLGEFPRLITLSLTDLGREGPFAAMPSSDLTVAALSGMAAINGVAGCLPLREPGNQTSVVAALAGYLGALAAIANRSQTGRGQAVDTSALEAMVNVLSPSVVQCSYQEGGPKRREKADGFLFDCADGQVSIITSSERSWETMVALWDLKVNPLDPRLATEGARRVNMDAVRELLGPVIMTKTRRELFEELCLVRVPCGMLMRPAELPDDPHLLERGSFVSILPRDGSAATTMPGPSFRVFGEKPPESIPLARIAEDTARVLAPVAGALAGRS